MDRVLYWNTRGCCGRGLVRHLKGVLNGMVPMLLILTDTKCEDDAKLRCIKSLGYDNMRVVPSVGAREEYWLLGGLTELTSRF